jgi:hypothetical protein
MTGAPEVDGIPDIRLSDHARDVMANRAIEFGEVLEVLRDYENRWSVDHWKGRPTPGRAVYQRGKLAVVVNERATAWWVVTVLLRENQQWTNEDARSRDSDAGSDSTAGSDG